MSRKARQFRIELGINLNASTIAHTDPAKQLYPLQNAPVFLHDETQSSPAWWTRFIPGDEVIFRLVDITNLTKPNPSDFGFEASIVFGSTDPSTGREVEPLTESPGKWTVSSTVENLTSPVYSPKVALPTRAIYPQNSSGPNRSVVLAMIPGSQLLRFEFKGELTAEIDGRTRRFIFDPEIIISDTSGTPGVPYPDSSRAISKW